MKMRKILLGALTTFTLAASVFITGCGSQDAGGSLPPAEESQTEIQTETAGKETAALAEKGIITLSVNPEISIEYDENGMVTNLTGNNVDG